MKNLKFCAVAVSVGLLMGALAGWQIGRRWTSGQVVWQEMLAAGGYSQLALFQYDQADTDHARQALMGFTTFSKFMSKLPSAQGDKALLVDTGRTYLRLAAIEELAGNSSLSHKYVLDAQATFRSMGREISEEDINKQVAKIVAVAPHPNGPPS